MDKKKKMVFFFFIDIAALFISSVGNVFILTGLQSHWSVASK